MSFMKDDRYKKWKTHLLSKAISQIVVGLFHPTTKCLAANFCKPLREMVRAEFSPRVKTTWHLPSHKAKGQRIHSRHACGWWSLLLSNSKKTNNLFMDLNDYNNSFNIYVTLKIFSKHFHTYSLISSFWQACEVGWASMHCKFGGWGNWGIQQLNNA